MGKNLGETLYKLLGFLAIIQAIRMLGHVLSYWAYDWDKDTPLNPARLFLAELVPFLLLLGCGCFLVLRSQHLAAQHPSDDAGSPNAASGARIHSILLSSAGMILIGLALSDIPSATTTLLIAYDQMKAFPISAPTLPRGWASLLGSLLQLGLGVFLVLRSSALVSAFRRRRDRARPIAVDGQCTHCGFWIVAKDYRADAQAYLCGNCKKEIPCDVIQAAAQSAA